MQCVRSIKLFSLTTSHSCRSLSSLLHGERRPARLISPRLRLRHEPLLVRRSSSAFRGSVGPSSSRFQRQQQVAAVSLDYSTGYMNQFRSAAGSGGQEADDDVLHHCPRLIDAELIHGDEQEFWTERRTFQRGGKSGRQTYAHSWDRQAQAMLMMVQRTPRSMAIAAFRLLALSHRLLLLPRLVSGLEGVLLPAKVGMQGAVMKELKKSAMEKEHEKEGKVKETPGAGPEGPKDK